MPTDHGPSDRKRRSRERQKNGLKSVDFDIRKEIPDEVVPVLNAYVNEINDELLAAYRSDLAGKAYIEMVRFSLITHINLNPQTFAQNEPLLITFAKQNPELFPNLTKFYSMFYPKQWQK